MKKDEKAALYTHRILGDKNTRRKGGPQYVAVAIPCLTCGVSTTHRAGKCKRCRQETQ